MMQVHLLLAHPSVSDLDEFLARISKVLGWPDLEERESSNYLEDRYFRGVVDGLEVMVCYAGSLVSGNISDPDNDEQKDLPYWVELKSDLLSEPELIEAADAIVKMMLLPDGFLAARLILGREDRRIDY